MVKHTIRTASQRFLRGQRKRSASRWRRQSLEQLESRCVLAATIAGQVFQDLNGDQVWQPAAPHLEPAADCWTVFLDHNRNGALDVNEPRQLTAHDGSYEFEVEDAGEYAVSLLQEPGFDRTTPIRFGLSSTAVAGQIQDHVFDPIRGLLYSSNVDRVLRTNLTNDGQLPIDLAVGGDLGALDITPNGQFLIVGERLTSEGQGRLYKIDLESEAITTIEFILEADEQGVFDLAAVSNERVLFTTGSATDSTVLLREVNLVTDAVTARTEDFGAGAGRIQAESRLQRNASHTTALLAEAHTASGSIRLYDSATNAFVASADLNAVLDDAHLAIDHSGTRVAVEAAGLGLQIYDAELDHVATPAHLAGGIAFDSTKNILYAGDLGTNELVALNGTDGSELYRVAAGEELTGVYHELQVNPRGTLLSYSTPTGIRYIQLDRPVAHVVNVADGQAVTGLDFGNWWNGGNRRPTAVANTFGAVEDSPLVVNAPGVLGNDSDPDGHLLAAQLVSGPAHGSVDLRADGSFTYVPVDNYFGLDSFTYQAFDGEFTSCRAVTVALEVAPVNDPPTGIIVLNPKVNENEDGGEIGEVIVIDGDGGDQFTLEVSDDRFEILNGILRVRPGVILDHEQGGTIDVVITATDDGAPPLSIDKTIQIEIQDINEHDPQIETTEIEVPEGQPTVGKIEVSDEDTSQTIEIAIVGGNEDGIFSINPTTGVIFVNDGFELDFEQTQIYVLTISATDSGEPAKTQTTEVSIIVTDGNEHDPIVTAETWEVDENAAEGTVVGTVSASDEDPNQTLTYSIVSGNDTGAFVIDSLTGEITVADGSQLDREQASEIVLAVQATDDGSPERSGTAEITIAIRNVNEFDPEMSDQTVTVSENLANGTVLVMMTATDADAVFNLVYSLNGNSAFAIDSQTGEITVADSAALDMETTQQIELQVTATDTESPARATTKTVTVHLQDVNEFDPVLGDQSLTLPEDSLPGYQLGQLSASDQDYTHPFSYSIVSGNDSGMFAIDSSTGAITFVSGSLSEHEGGSDIVLTVRVTDNLAPARTDDAEVTISVSPPNAPPTADDDEFSLPENSGNGTIVGTVSASDPEGTDLTYSLGGDSGPFAIDSQTGEITVADSGFLNFELTNQFTLTVTVTDAGLPAKSTQATIEISLTDVNEFAPTIDDLAFSIEENAPSGQVLGTVQAFDEDTNQTVKYSLAGSGFAIGETSGVITVASGAQLDYEANPVVTLTVTATDNGNPIKSSTATITIQLIDRNEAAPVAPNKTFSIVENPASETVLGTVTATDADAGQTLTYEIMAGNFGSAFEIHPTTGEITVLNSSSIDAETIPQFLLLVRVSDSGTPGMNGTATVTVNVQGVNEAPIALTLSNDVVSEQVKGATVGLVSVIDFDAGDHHTFEVDDSRFLIEVETRMLKLKEGEQLDFDAAIQIPLEITATDSGGLSVSQNFVINVMEVSKPWQNATSPLDIDNDGIITPSDVLKVINEINNPKVSDSSGKLPDVHPGDPLIPFYDVNGDGSVSPIDVLIIINGINEQSTQAEGEGFAAIPSPPAAVVTVTAPPRGEPLVMPTQPGAISWDSLLDDDEDEDELEATLDDLAEDLAVAWGE